MAGAGDPALRQAKKALRERVLGLRDALDPETRREHSRRITARLLSLPELRAAATIAAFSSFGSEFDTSGFLAAVLAQGRRLLLPRVDRASNRIEFRAVGDLGRDLGEGTWGIREPLAHCPVVSADAVDFVLVPGVAATRRGDRLGYGGGYYDRFLAGVKPGVPRVLALFSVQVVDAVPLGEFDLPVTCVVTEETHFTPV